MEFCQIPVFSPCERCFAGPHELVREGIISEDKINSHHKSFAHGPFMGAPSGPASCLTVWACREATGRDAFSFTGCVAQKGVELV